MYPLELIEQSKILFAGVGGLGSLTVELLAYPFREIVLIDPETLGEENVERHLLGRSEVGKPKVEGVRRWLIDRGVPEERITTHQADVRSVLRQHVDTSVIISSVNVWSVDNAITVFCAENNIPAVYGGVYDLAVAGLVTVIPNASDICYVCARRVTDGIDTYLPEGCGVDMDQLVDEEDGQGTTPALRWAIAAIACHMADYSLELLKGGGTAQQVFHGHNSRAELPMGSAEELQQWAALVRSQSGIEGLLPNFGFDHKDGEQYLTVRRGIAVYNLERWTDCPLHAA